MTPPDPTRRIIAAQQRDLDRAARPAPVAPGTDRDGAPPMHGPSGLAQSELNTWRRFSPRRNRWPELRAVDERVADLERRRSETAAELAQLNERRQAAPLADADALADWELAGRNGPRPEPQAEEIQAEIRRRQADADGLDVAITRVLEERVQFVERHRRRLVRDADRAVTEAHVRLHALLDQLAAARDDLIAKRHDVLWARLYPDATAGVEAPRHAMLAGGLRQPIEQALGVNLQFPATRVIAALKSDADWIKDAATPEQKQRLQGREGRQTNAVWAGGNGAPPSPEAVEQDRAEKKRQLEAYRQEWGRYPA